jgi:hypothetical protein
MYVLIDDDRVGLALRRLRPWHRVLARCQAGRLDRELAEGASPEASAPPRVPLRHARISQSARLLAEVATRLAAPGPVPARGVAIVTRLQACRGGSDREACSGGGRLPTVGCLRSAAYGRPRRHCGLRLPRNARIPSRASGSWLVAAMTSMA